MDFRHRAAEARAHESVRWLEHKPVDSPAEKNSVTQMRKMALASPHMEKTSLDELWQGIRQDQGPMRFLEDMLRISLKSKCLTSYEHMNPSCRASHNTLISKFSKAQKVSQR